MATEKISEKRSVHGTRKLLAPGASFQGRYEVIRSIGTGGMGEVYEVSHLATRRRLALKVLKATTNDVWLTERFAQEAYVTAEVSSDHIVQVHDAGFDEEYGLPFLIMELLEGKDLSLLLDERGRLPPAAVLTLLRQVACGLEKTHAAGIVHRDLKPGNVFVTRAEDGAPRVKLLDFGIARMLTESRKKATSTRSVGTPMYMPPEQLKGEASISAPADLYALTHVAYHLLVGEPYFAPERDESGSEFSFLVSVVAGLSQPACARAAERKGVRLPERFEAWFAKGAHAEASERFTSATELVESLHDVFDGSAPTVRRPEPPLDLLDATTTRMARKSADSGAHTSPVQAAEKGESAGAASISPTLLTPTSQPPLPRRRRRLFVAAAMLLLFGAVAGGLWSYLHGEQLGSGPAANAPVSSGTAQGLDSATDETEPDDPAEDPDEAPIAPAQSSPTAVAAPKPARTASSAGSQTTRSAMKRRSKAPPPAPRPHHKAGDDDSATPQPNKPVTPPEEDLLDRR